MSIFLTSLKGRPQYNGFRIHWGVGVGWFRNGYQGMPMHIFLETNPTEPNETYFQVDTNRIELL